MLTKSSLPKCCRKSVFNPHSFQSPVKKKYHFSFNRTPQTCSTSKSLLVSSITQFTPSFRLFCAIKPSTLYQPNEKQQKGFCFKTELENYLQLIRFRAPIGTYLIYFPSTWGITLASIISHSPIPTNLLISCAFGAFFMRSAGCIVNDIWDRKIDSKVERTAKRPIASGKLSVNKAIGYLGLNLSAALGILLTMNYYTIYLASCSVALVVAYPLFKRFTYWPQAFLGLCMNYGVLVGYSASAGSLAPLLPVSLLFLSGISWTLMYDTIYAYQDRKDDLKIGVKSTAILFGNSKSPLYFFSLFSNSCLNLIGALLHFSVPYFGIIAAGQFTTWTDTYSAV